MSLPEAAPAAVGDAADRIDGFFAPRAGDVDAGRATVREGIRFLGMLGLAEADAAESVEIIGRVARSDLASAFSAWAHRMAIDYISLAPAGSPVHDLLPDLRSGHLLGATALAGGIARHLSGTALPVTYRADGARIRLDGRIPWASNLLPPFVAVTAAVHAGDPQAVLVVALSDAAPGLSVAPCPQLLALEATGSSSVAVQGVKIPAGFVVAAELGPFIERILPRFLLLQTAFCLGLAGAALDAAAAGTGPLATVLVPEVERLHLEVARAGRRLRGGARRVDRHGPEAVARRELLSLRLTAAQLAGEAVRAELAGAGGRGYLRDSATARRVREAAFLPIQSPTELQLRWLLSRSG